MSLVNIVCFFDQLTLYIVTFPLTDDEPKHIPLTETHSDISTTTMGSMGETTTEMTWLTDSDTTLSDFSDIITVVPYDDEFNNAETKAHRNTDSTRSVDSVTISYDSSVSDDTISTKYENLNVKTTLEAIEDSAVTEKMENELSSKYQTTEFLLRSTNADDKDFQSTLESDELVQSSSTIHIESTPKPYKKNYHNISATPSLENKNTKTPENQRKLNNNYTDISYQTTIKYSANITKKPVFNRDFVNESSFTDFTDSSYVTTSEKTSETEISVREYLDHTPVTASDLVTSTILIDQTTELLLLSVEPSGSEHDVTTTEGNTMLFNSEPTDLRTTIHSDVTASDHLEHTIEDHAQTVLNNLETTTYPTIISSEKYTESTETEISSKPTDFRKFEQSTVKTLDDFTGHNILSTGFRTQPQQLETTTDTVISFDKSTEPSKIELTTAEFISEYTDSRASGYKTVTSFHQNAVDIEHSTQSTFSNLETEHNIFDSRSESIDSKSSGSNTVTVPYNNGDDIELITLGTLSNKETTTDYISSFKDSEEPTATELSLAEVMTTSTVSRTSTDADDEVHKTQNTLSNLETTTGSMTSVKESQEPTEADHNISEITYTDLRTPGKSTVIVSDNEAFVAQTTFSNSETTSNSNRIFEESKKYSVAELSTLEITSASTDARTSDHSTATIPNHNDEEEHMTQNTLSNFVTTTGSISSVDESQEPTEAEHSTTEITSEFTEPRTSSHSTDSTFDHNQNDQLLTTTQSSITLFEESSESIPTASVVISESTDPRSSVFNTVTALNHNPDDIDYTTTIAFSNMEISTDSVLLSEMTSENQLSNTTSFEFFMTSTIPNSFSYTNISDGSRITTDNSIFLTEKNSEVPKSILTDYQTSTSNDVANSDYTEQNSKRTTFMTFSDFETTENNIYATFLTGNSSTDTTEFSEPTHTSTEETGTIFTTPSTDDLLMESNEHFIDVTTHSLVTSTDLSTKTQFSDPKTSSFKHSEDTVETSESTTEISFTDLKTTTHSLFTSTAEDFNKNRAALTGSTEMYLGPTMVDYDPTTLHASPEKVVTNSIASSTEPVLNITEQVSDNIATEDLMTSTKKPTYEYSNSETSIEVKPVLSTEPVTNGVETTSDSNLQKTENIYTKSFTPFTETATSDSVYSLISMPITTTERTSEIADQNPELTTEKNLKEMPTSGYDTNSVDMTENINTELNLNHQSTMLDLYKTTFQNADTFAGYTTTYSESSTISPKYTTQTQDRPSKHNGNILGNNDDGSFNSGEVTQVTSFQRTITDQEQSTPVTKNNDSQNLITSSEHFDYETTSKTVTTTHSSKDGLDSYTSLLEQTTKTFSSVTQPDSGKTTVEDITVKPLTVTITTKKIPSESFTENIISTNTDGIEFIFRTDLDESENAITGKHRLTTSLDNNIIKTTQKSILNDMDDIVTLFDHTTKIIDSTETDLTQTTHSVASSTEPTLNDSEPKKSVTSSYDDGFSVTFLDPEGTKSTAKIINVNTTKPSENNNFKTTEVYLHSNIPSSNKTNVISKQNNSTISTSTENLSSRRKDVDIPAWTDSTLRTDTTETVTETTTEITEQNVRIRCNTNSQCLTNETCIIGVCRNPCETMQAQCAENMACEVVEHAVVCVCVAVDGNNCPGMHFSVFSIHVSYRKLLF